MKISELIKRLEMQQELHGDVQVYSGNYYPENIQNVVFIDNNKTYYEPNCVVIQTAD